MWKWRVETIHGVEFRMPANLERLSGNSGRNDAIMRYDWGTSPWLSAFKPFLEPEGFETFVYVYMNYFIICFFSPFHCC